MALIEFQFDIKGTTPLLMHAPTSINPVDPQTRALVRAVSAYKASKTEAAFYEVAQLEHRAGIYYDPDLGPFIPSENASKCLVDAGKVTRRGTKVKDAVLITELLGAPLIYSGPRDYKGLWENKDFVHYAPVGVATNRVMRCRPIFRTWELTFHGVLDDSVLEFADFLEVAGHAGLKGLGDWRPRFGRFLGEVTKL